MSYEEKAKARLLAKVEVLPDGCWRWVGNITGRYGSMVFRGRDVRAHRVAYEVFVGPIPDGLQIDHLCRNTHCVNPEHLEPVTAAENKRRGYESTLDGKCRRGLHANTPENLIQRGDGKRECRPCHLDRVHEHRVRQRAAKAAA